MVLLTVLAVDVHLGTSRAMELRFIWTSLPRNFVLFKKLIILLIVALLVMHVPVRRCDVAVLPFFGF
jgi:hypothetical protein